MTAAEKTRAVVDAIEVHDPTAPPLEAGEIRIAASNWQPGYKARFPLLGALEILGVILCAAATVIVLVLSDHASATNWLLAPNIIIQGLSSISNLCLALAVVEGIAIAWWRKALKGATVAELHNSWAFSTSFSNILQHYRHLDAVALAALAAKLCIADGVLFQRATSTYTTQDPARNVTVLGAAAQTFPETGYVVAEGFGAQTDCNCFMIGDTYTPTVDTWEKSNGFYVDFQQLFMTCNGICYASVDAIGFEIDCQKTSDHRDYAIDAINAYNSGNGTGNATQWTDLPIFNSSFAMQYPDSSQNYPSLALNLLYFDSDDPYNPNAASCPGTITNVQCQLRPALIRYPVTIVNYTNPHITNGVSIGGRSSDESNTAPQTIPNYLYSNKQAEGFEVLSYLNVSDQNVVNTTTQLGGIANALSQFASSSAAITYKGDDTWSLSQKGILSQSMMFGPPNMGSCDCSFRDALSTLVSAVNQLSFLTATSLIQRPVADAVITKGMLVPVTGIKKNTTASFQALPNTIQISDVIHYETNYLFMGLGLATMLGSILLIVPAFWRYGELGRPVTLGPMEIASAFRAPMLETGDGEAHVGNLDELIERVGDRKVLYGVMDDEPSNVVEGERKAENRKSVRLCLEEPEKVRPIRSPTIRSPTMSPRSSTFSRTPTSPMDTRPPMSPKDSTEPRTPTSPE